MVIQNNPALSGYWSINPLVIQLLIYPASDTGDNMMGTFIDDAIYNYLNTDAEPANDVDIFFNNAGGIRTDWCYVGGAWVNTGCVAGTHASWIINIRKYVHGPALRECHGRR